MKRRWIRLSQQYKAALQKYQQQGAQTSRQFARTVGRQAAANGLNALALARIHDKALATLGLPISSNGKRYQTDAFFAEACQPLGVPNCTTGGQVLQLKKKLRQRTTELASSRRIRRQQAERGLALRHTLKTSAASNAFLLAESRELQLCLRRLTRRILAVQEEERATISRKLHEDVAQEILGTQVRLTQLKTEATRDTRSLIKEIVRTQRLVEKSAKTLERFAGRLSSGHESRVD